MPFTYPCRLLEDERYRVVYDNSGYAILTEQDWAPIVSKNITLDKDLLVYIRVKVTAGSDAYGAVRVRDENGNNLLVTGGLHNETVEREVLIPMSSGSHTLYVQGACWDRVSTNITLDELEVGYVNFADLAIAHYHASSLGVANGGSIQLISQQFTLPSGNTPAGQINDVPLYVIAVVQADDVRGTKMINSDESPPSGKCGAKLWIDSEAQDWAARYNDYDDGSISHISYGEGSIGIFRTLENAGNQVYISLYGHNNTGAGVNMTADVWVIACPWLIPGGWSEPISLDFPIYSTLDIVLEPLLDSGTIFAVYLGKQRVKSFGTVTDYYDSASGSGEILYFSHTFEKIKPAALKLLFYCGSGLWTTCISSIMVDVR